MWIGNPDDRTNPERTALLERRAELVKQVEARKKNAPASTAAGYIHKFYREDLTKLAKEILNIDKKLGRK